MGRVPYPSINLILYRIKISRNHIEDLGKLFNLTLPAKLQTYLACGAPILAAAGGESADVIQKACCGIAVEPELQALVTAVKEMAAQSREQRQAQANAGREYYEKHFTMDRLIGQLIALMDATQSENK